MKTKILVVGLALFVFAALAVQHKPSPKQSVTFTPYVPPVVSATPQAPKPSPTPTSYDEALALSKSSKKPLLLFFHASWCHYCVEMEQKTLSDNDVKRAMGAYVFYSVDSDREKPLTRKFGVSALPTIIQADDTEKVIKKTSGFQEKDKFINWLK